jgi:hypothetical protein
MTNSDKQRPLESIDEGTKSRIIEAISLNLIGVPGCDYTYVWRRPPSLIKRFLTWVSETRLSKKKD